MTTIKGPTLEEALAAIKAKLSRPTHPAPPDPRRGKAFEDLLTQDFNSRAKAREALLAAMIASDDLEPGPRKDLLSEAIKAYEFATLYNVMQALEIKGSIIGASYKKPFGEAAVKHIKQLKLLSEVLLPRKEPPPAT